MSNKKNKEKTLSLNAKITIITIVAAVWIICLAFALAMCENKNTDSAQQDADIVQNAESEIKTYETKSTGTVSKENSKTFAYFNSHFKESYYRVNEYAVSSVQDGNYCQTETIAYSTDGYLYRKICDSSYAEQDDANSIVYLYTPTNSYILYPGLKTYFAGEGNTQGYTNTIDFECEQFNTGTININGFEYYYEENTDSLGVTYRYCYDEKDELRYRISSSEQGTITEAYKEYSKDVDPSLFEIPADYTLQQ